MYLKTDQSRGDTIIEVLLAIAIISLVMAGAFAATNRSLKASRAAQERSEALKFGEEQIERLKYKKDDATWVEPASPFCIQPDGTSIKETIIDISSEPLCKFGERYYVSVEKDAQNIYRVRVLWPNLTATGSVTVGAATYANMDNLQLFYRILDPGVTPPYPPGPPGPGPFVAQPYENLTHPPAPRPPNYNSGCFGVDNLTDPVEYYSHNGQPCPGTGAFVMFVAGNESVFNVPCQFNDGSGRYAYISGTTSDRCPAGGMLAP